MSTGAVLSPQNIAPKYKRTVLLSLLAFIVSFCSTLAWRVLDVDFVTRIGSGRLAIVYVYAAIVVFSSSALMMIRSSRVTPQAIFQSVQKYATVGFVIIGGTQWAFDTCQHTWMLYGVKIFGYAYSILLFNAFWIALDPCNDRLHPSKLQTTLYSVLLYFGMASAGIWLQAYNLGAGQVGIVATFCSLLCWIIGRYAFDERGCSSLNDSAETNSDPIHRHHISKIIPLLFRSKRLIVLVLVSVFFSILVRSTEYSFIADFETRYLSVDNSGNGWRSIGSFVTLIGLGNIITLISWQIWSKCTIGRASLPIATVVAFCMINYDSTNNYPLFASVFVLIVVESLYAIVVESNLQHLLEYFDKQDRSVTRVLIDAVVEPAGLLLSAFLFLFPGFSIRTLGVIVVFATFLVLLYNWRVRRENALSSPKFFRRSAHFLFSIERKKKDQAMA
jgi:hypothetical protein